jgi:hypothetical protein
MKILLRRTISGFYYRNNDDWTDLPEAAQQFSKLDEAVETARSLHVSGVEAVISVAGGKYEVLMKIT